VLPVLLVLAALLWQAVVAGQALWLSAAAARAAARAAAVGADPEAAARGTLPRSLQHHLHVDRDHDAVRVDIAIPSVLTSGALATIESRASFPGQSR